MTRSAPVLVTGFEPFGGHAINPSALVTQALHGRTIDGTKVAGLPLAAMVDGVAIALATAAQLSQR